MSSGLLDLKEYYFADSFSVLLSLIRACFRVSAGSRVGSCFSNVYSAELHVVSFLRKSAAETGWQREVPRAAACLCTATPPGSWRGSLSSPGKKDSCPDLLVSVFQKLLMYCTNLLGICLKWQLLCFQITSTTLLDSIENFGFKRPHLQV